MNAEDCKKVELVAEVRVRRFFDHYLNEVFPEQLAAVISAHDSDVDAHVSQIKTAVRAESSRIRLWLVGVIFAGGLGGGVGVAKLVAVIVGN